MTDFQPDQPDNAKMIKERLDRILPGVAKPARYTGNELNLVRKDWQDAPVKMAFAFPDVYEIGMSHLGGRILYGLVNDKSPHLMERVFAPWPDFESGLREAGLPLYSLESFQPLSCFDIIGFSLQYELSITNCLNMLDLSGIPVWSSERNSRHPLIIAGGPLCFNPEPYAGFFDLFIIGDAEELLPELLDRMSAMKERPREELIRQLAKLTGVYAPALYSEEYSTDGMFAKLIPLESETPARIRKGLVEDLDGAYFPDKPVLPYIEIVHDRATLELMRGCQRACRFCQAGSIYRPLRERSVSVLREQAEKQLASTGYDEISLSSLSTLDYSGIHSLVRELVACYGAGGVGVSLPSLRVDTASVEVASEIQKVRKSTLTFAPEAGSQRLRDIINKNVSEQDILDAAAAAFQSGWLALKLYFMLGLPGEKYEDLDAIIDLLRKISQIARGLSKRRPEIRASFSYFVPKAHTPFQWSAQNSPEEYVDKMQYLKQHRIKNVKMSFHDQRSSFLEGTLARGDRRLSAVIHQAWKNGCKFDGWTDHFNFEAWQAAFDSCGIDPGSYIYRTRGYNEALPWDFIDTGLDKSYLIEESRRSEQGTLTPDCRLEGCVDCGVCDNFGVSLVVRQEDSK